MAGPDIVLLVVGVVLFSGATYALTTQEGGIAGALGGTTSALGVYQVTYATHAHEVGRESVANMAGSQTLTFNVTEDNLVKVIVSVSCTDPAAGTPVGFSVTVDVEGPDGLTGEGSGACGTPILVEMPVGTIPPDASVQARTDTEARENLEPAEDADKGVGEWTVSLTGTRQGQGALPVGNPTGAVSLSIERYEASFSPVQR